MPPGGDSVLLNGVRYLLARQKDGTPQYGMAPTPFFPVQSTAEEVTEAAFPPEHRQPYSFRDLSGGAGQTEVPIVGPNRKYDRIGDAEGEGIDTTLTPRGPIILAAKLVTNSPLTPNDWLYTGVLWQGGATAYFTLGRYVWSWDGTTFTNVGDATDPQASLWSPMISFRGAQSQDYWYIPTVSGQVRYSTDSGVTWSSVGTGGGVNKAGSMLVVDGEVVFSAGSPRFNNKVTMVASFDDGGATPTMYGVIDPIGDPTFEINKLVNIGGVVLALKDREGVFALTGSRRTLAVELLPELRGAQIFFTGTRTWRNLLWLPTALGLYTIGPDLSVQKVGPELTEARSATGGRGPVQALAGDAHHLYAYRSGSGVGSTIPSVLQKAEIDIAGGRVVRADWHDFLQLGAGEFCSGMDVLGINNVSQLLFYRQTAAGVRGMNFIRLAVGGGDPRADIGYNYCAAGTLYYSRQTARFPQANKVFFGMTPLAADLGREVDGQTSTAAQSLTPRYKLDTTPLTGATPFGYTAGTTQTTGTGSRESFAVRGRGLDTALRLATSDEDTTPQVSAVTVEYAVEPNVLYQHHMVLDVSAGALQDSGATPADPMPPGVALATLRALPASGTMAFVDPWGNEYTVTVPLTGVKPRAGGPAEAAGSQEIPLLVEVTVNEQ